MLFPDFESVSTAIAQEGLSFLILVRLAPYPFGLTSVALSTTQVSSFNFIIATTISVFKNIIHVYIGSTVRDLASSHHWSIYEWLFMIFGFLFAVSVFLYMRHRINTVIARLQRDEDTDLSISLEPSTTFPSEMYDTDEVDELLDYQKYVQDE